MKSDLYGAFGMGLGSGGALGLGLGAFFHGGFEIGLIGIAVGGICAVLGLLAVSSRTDGSSNP